MNSMRAKTNVKIYGAGSIGNHLAQASRRMGWDVCVVDPDQDALDRMRSDIYPARYGAWDEGIKLYTFGNEPHGGFDIIMLGTPPDVRMKLARKVLEESPRAILLEKPLCTPSCEGLSEFVAEADAAGVLGFVGYDHAVSPGIEFVSSLLRKNSIGEVQALDVEFREEWGGIFKAHPWLKGPSDSYLGYTSRGGGASGEHSHALHLWYTLAQAAGLGQWKCLYGVRHRAKEPGAEYDDASYFTLTTASGVVGRVAQDVVTSPPRKWARVQGAHGFIEWLCNGLPEGGDVVRFSVDGNKTVNSTSFAKKRPDDFYAEMLHIDSVLNGDIAYNDSPIALSSGVAVMRVLKAT